MDTKSVRLFVLAADKFNISAAGRELEMAPAVTISCVCIRACGWTKDDVTRLLIGANGEPAEFNTEQAGSRLMVDDGLSHRVATISGAGISINSLWSVHREIHEGTLVRVLPIL